MAKKVKKDDHEVIEGFIEGEENKQRSIYFIYSQTIDNVQQIKFKAKEEKYKYFEPQLKYSRKKIQIDQNKNIISIFEI